MELLIIGAVVFSSIALPWAIGRGLSYKTSKEQAPTSTETASSILTDTPDGMLVIQSNDADEPYINLADYPPPSIPKHLSNQEKFLMAAQAAQQYHEQHRSELALHYALHAEAWFMQASFLDNNDAHLRYTQTLFLIGQTLLSPQRIGTDRRSKTPMQYEDSQILALRLAQSYLKKAISGYQHLQSHGHTDCHRLLCEGYIQLAQTYVLQDAPEQLPLAKQAYQLASQTFSNSEKEAEILIVAESKCLLATAYYNQNQASAAEQHYQGTLTLLYTALIQQGWNNGQHSPDLLQSYRRTLAATHYANLECETPDIPDIPTTELEKASYLTLMIGVLETHQIDSVDQHIQWSLRRFDRALRTGKLNTATLCQDYLTMFEHLFKLAPVWLEKYPRTYLNDLDNLYEHIEQQTFQVKPSTALHTQAAYIHHQVKKLRYDEQAPQALLETGIELWATIYATRPSAAGTYAEMILTFLRKHDDVNENITQHVKQLIPLCIEATHHQPDDNQPHDQLQSAMVYIRLRLLKKDQQFVNDAEEQTLTFYKKQFTQQPWRHAPYYACVLATIGRNIRLSEAQQHAYFAQAVGVLTQGYAATPTDGQRITINTDYEYLDAWIQLARQTTFISLRSSDELNNEDKKQLWTRIAEKLQKALTRYQQHKSAYDFQIEDAERAMQRLQNQLD